MAQIEIYTKAWCPYCHRAKQLLHSKGLHFQEVSVDNDAKQMERMQSRSGRKTVPQIFIDGRHIGGSDDLESANQTGALDQLLSAGAA